MYVKKASLEKMSLSLFMTRIKTLFHYLQFQFFFTPSQYHSFFIKSTGVVGLGKEGRGGELNQC